MLKHPAIAFFAYTFALAPEFLKNAWHTNNST
jgi:hypothetical protein